MNWLKIKSNGRQIKTFAVVRFLYIYTVRFLYTVNSLYTDRRYNDKIRYNDTLNDTKLIRHYARILYFTLQETYLLHIC